MVATILIQDYFSLSTSPHLSISLPLTWKDFPQLALPINLHIGYCNVTLTFRYINCMMNFESAVFFKQLIHILNLIGPQHTYSFTTFRVTWRSPHLSAFYWISRILYFRWHLHTSVFRQYGYAVLKQSHVVPPGRLKAFHWRTYTLIRIDWILP